MTRRLASVALRASALAAGLPACGASPRAIAVAVPDPCAALLWWNQPRVAAEAREVNDTGGETTVWDLDYAVPSGTPVQLPCAATLLSQAVYPWGWQPTFVDGERGHVFRFLHLRPQAQLVTAVGATYAAGTIVGLSGGDTWDTGYERPACDGTICSRGAHLCVEADTHVGELFPAEVRACPPGTPGAARTPASRGGQQS